MASRSHSKKFIFLGAGFTTRNMGVWALASGAIHAALNKYPDACISFLDYSADPAHYTVEHNERKISIQLFNIRFSKKIWEPNHIARLLFSALIIRALPGRYLKGAFINRNPWIKHIHQADTIGSIAGGDSFSDIYGLRRLIYVALPQMLVLCLGKPLYLLPQTIGPFNSILGRAIARLILRHCHKMYCRDHESLDTIRTLIPNNEHRMSFCFDMGFVLEPKISESKLPPWLTNLNADIPIIGINVSGLLYIGGYTRDNMFGLKSDYRDVVKLLIAKIIKTYNVHVMLVPHVFGAADNRESDVAACKEVFCQIEEGARSQVHVIDQQYNHHETKAIIGRCQFFMGSRMHACIAALSQAIPAVALAYSKKFVGVYRSISLEELVIDLRSYNVDSVIRECIQLYEKRMKISKHLRDRLPDIRNDVLALFSQ